jgi:hypothetical protein
MLWFSATGPSPSGRICWSFRESLLMSYRIPLACNTFDKEESEAVEAVVPSEPGA